jgi:hypothetical protein
VLQVADEIDDVVGVLRHGLLGIRAQTSVLIAAVRAATGGRQRAGVMTGRPESNPRGSSL